MTSINPSDEDGHRIGLVEPMPASSPAGPPPVSPWWRTRAAILSGAAVLLLAVVGATVAVTLTLVDRSPAAAPPPPAQPNVPNVPDTLGACDDLAGTPTSQIVQISLCTTPGGGQQILVSAFYDCSDGRRLYWNDTGWGYLDGVWQEHQRSDGQLVPPQEEMDACT